MKKMISMSVIAAFLMLCIVSVSAMTAETVVSMMKEAYLQQIRNINDYTVISENETKYHRKTIIAGEPFFQTRTEMETGGYKYVSIDDGEYLWHFSPMGGMVEKEKSERNDSEFFKSFADAKIEYLGEENLDGNKTYTFRVDELNLMMEDDRDEKYSGKVWIDAKDRIVRKMVLDTRIEEEKGTMTIELKDYRNFNGLLIPFTTQIAVSSSLAAMSREEEQEMRENLAEMKSQLANMPAAQRQMVEGMMRPQMEMMENLLKGEGLTQTIRVKEVKINTGLSDDLFNPNLLGK